MSDDQLPETPPPASTPAAAPAQQPAASALESPEVKAFVAAEVERARNATWKQARETIGKKSNGTTTTAQQQPEPAQTTQPTAGDVDFARNRVYERTLARFDISDEAMAILDEDFARAKPADVGSWVTQRLTAFGAKQRGATTNPPTTSTPATAAQTAPVVVHAGPPVTSSGAPISSTTVTADTPLIQMSEADRVSFIRQHGDVAYTDRFKKEARERGSRIPLSALFKH